MNTEGTRRERLDSWVARWSGGDGREDASEGPDLDALEGAVSDWPDEVFEPWLVKCLESDDVWWGKMVVHSLGVAVEGGARLCGWLDEDVVLAEVDGREVALGFLSLADPRADTGAIARVEEALDLAFGREEYVLHVRRAPNLEVDLEPLVQAVRLWVATPFDPELCSAVYDDGEVAVHLRRTGTFVGAGAGARQMTVPDMDGWREVCGMRRTVEAHDVGGRPRIWVCGRDQGQPWSPGLMRQILYGCPREIDATERDVTARFTRDKATLFGGKEGGRVLSLWWVGGGAEDPLSFTTWIHDNPWVERSEVALNPPAASATADRACTGANDERRVEGITHAPTRWGSAP